MDLLTLPSQGSLYISAKGPWTRNAFRKQWPY
jgi:hypothetical protein